VFIPLVTKEPIPHKIKVTKTFFKDTIKYDSDFFYDYAILILESEIGFDLGYLGTKFWTETNKLPDSKLIGFTNDLKNTYEIGKNSFYNFPFLLEIKLDYFNNFFRYNADSTSGQCGSSIIYLDSNTKEYNIIGLHLGKIKNNFTPVMDNNNNNKSTKNKKSVGVVDPQHNLNIGIFFDESFQEQIIEWIKCYNISMNNLPIFKKLNLGWKGLDDEDIDVLPKLNTLCIKELFLSNNNFTDETFKLLLKVKLDNLNTLNFKSNKLSFACFKEEIYDSINFLALNTLNLSSNLINDEGFLCILEKFVFGKLVIMDLSSNFIVGEILNKLGEEKDFKFPYLEKLDISDNKINKEGKSLLENKIIIEKGILIFSHSIKSIKKIIHK